MAFSLFCTRAPDVDCLAQGLFFRKVACMGYGATASFLKPVVSNLGHAKTSYINRNETREPLEPRTSADPRTREDSSLSRGAGMPETGSVIPLTGQNHINN
jgi:hypothetical protein